MVKEIYKGHYSPFSKRLRALVEKHNTKQAELAELLRVTRQSIGQYADGTSLPPVDKIIELANYYNVSTDYIFGLTDIASTDAELKSVCEYTGLSEKVIVKLNKKTDKFDFDIKYDLDIVNELLKKIIDVIV